MHKLNLPHFEFKTKYIDDKLHIFDDARRKFIRLTPEEWVRQNFTKFLILHKGYPQGRIAQEVSIELNTMPRRIDTVIYDKFSNPIVLVEYKSPNIKITQEVFNQIVRYNMVLKVPYLIVSNGLNHYCCKIDYSCNKASYLHDIPNFEDL